jgi:hypothetical protein
MVIEVIAQINLVWILGLLGLLGTALSFVAAFAFLL